MTVTKQVHLPVSSFDDHRYHRIALLAVSLAAFLTRFCGIAYPSDVVFDEAHTVRFLSWYLSGEYFFDLHPPLSRLIFYGLAKVFGWEGGFTPRDAGDSYLTRNMPYVAFRSVPAMFSTLTVPLVYLTLWELDCGLPACALAAGLLAFDTAHVTHGRTIYLDGMVCFFIVATILSYIKFAKQSEWTRQWWCWLSLTGTGLTCIMCTKMVGAFTYLTIGIFTLKQLWDLFDVKSGRSVNLVTFCKHVLARVVVLIVVPFLIYLLCFYVHFAILYKSGEGDDYMSDRFVLSLSNNPANITIPLSFPRKWLELQELMLSLNADVGKGYVHPYQTRPYQWPFPSRGVLFWCSDETRQHIFFTGNIPGWWIASGCVLATLILIPVNYLCDARGVFLFGEKAKSMILHHVSGLLIIAYLAHYIPFWLMNRQLMMHSYLPAHTISTMIAGSLLELFESSSKISRRSVWIICGSCLISAISFWWFWIPLTYGQPYISPDAVRRREMFGMRLLFSPDYNMTSCRD